MGHSRQKFVAYYRVSTNRQGKSGLGLEAQQAAVTGFLGGGELVKEFTEIESGRKTDENRPQLKDAMESCRIHQATLIVAKLDRLARNAHFLLGLRDAGIDFICVDMPNANRLTVGILAMVAEEEARAISARTKAALAAAKSRGVKLGTNNLTQDGCRVGSVRGTKVRQHNADTFAQRLAPVINEIKNSGIVSFRGIAKELNVRGIPTRRGGQWQTVQVQRIIKRT